MRKLLKPDLPTGTAATIAVLVLLASVVTGREETHEPPTNAAPPAAALAPSAAAEDLDLSRLKRWKKDGEPPDLFATRAPVLAVVAPQNAAPPKPARAPAPTAPPLPFKYLGRMADGGKVVVFLERNTDSLAVAAGDTLDNTYQVESIGDSAVHFVYLPLGAKQVLGIPAQY